MTKIELPKGIKKDKQTVTPDSKPLIKLPEGVSLKEIKTHIDERGSIAEIFDTRWEWSKKPLVYAHMLTIKPGITKGWNLHMKSEDRYFLMFGEMQVVLYDVRKDSKTFGLASEIIMTEFNRSLLNIPAGIWHADRNIGTKDVVAINMPTKVYDHKNPDKYRLPLNTDKIPYKFDNPKGW